MSTALSNARSGLTSVSRAAEVVSNNVANAMSDGYSRQEITLAARVTGLKGAGVTVTGVRRAHNPALTTIYREASGSSRYADVVFQASNRIATTVGKPGEPNALPATLARFESALRRLHATPSSVPLQTRAVQSAEAVAKKINAIATGVRSARQDADSAIAREVAEVNAALDVVADLNHKIRQLAQSGRETTALEDRRDSFVTRITDRLPVRQFNSSSDGIALALEGGTILLDGAARHIEFIPTAGITPQQTLANGALGGLHVNGTAIVLQGKQGSIAAHFAVRDDWAPATGTMLDGLARDLVERFQDPLVDTSLVPGAAGLYTDAGNPFNPANQTGLSERIALNGAVLPTSGGALWRIRDGVGAVTQGNAGDNRIINNMLDALGTNRLSPSALGHPATLSASGFANSFAAQMLSDAEAAEVGRATQTGRLQTIQEQEKAVSGVDTDAQMQRLLTIEKAYAANVRVLSTVDNLMKQLLEI